MNYELITKEQFDIASEKYPQGKLVKFAYDYFLTANTHKIGKYIMNILFIAFISIFFSIVLGAPRFVNVILISIYGGGCFGWAAYLYVATLLNNKRLDKIRKELGDITHYEYAQLLLKFNYAKNG
jgi:hypothetical protein